MRKTRDRLKELAEEHSETWKKEGLTNKEARLLIGLLQLKVEESEKQAGQKIGAEKFTTDQ